MKYKALFLDLDGTTIRYKSLTPTRHVIEAVKKANNLVTVCIATGRILEHTQPIIEALGITGPCVIDQGTQIYNPVTKSMTEELLLPPETFPEIVSIMRSHNYMPYVFDGEKNVPYKSGQAYPKVVSVFVDSLPLSDEEPLMKDLSDIHNVSIHRMVGKTEEYISIEITHPLGTKQHGIEKVAKILGVDTHEIIGVGDGYNDFPMLMACGLKVAMENAVPELKDIADFIAPSVDEDGVATVIEKFVLQD